MSKGSLSKLRFVQNRRRESSKRPSSSRVRTVTGVIEARSSRISEARLPTRTEDASILTQLSENTYSTGVLSTPERPSSGAKAADPWKEANRSKERATSNRRQTAGGALAEEVDHYSPIPGSIDVFGERWLTDQLFCLSQCSEDGRVLALLRLLPFDARLVNEHYFNLSSPVQ
ncbi:hypothetical protein K0M31_010549 [Melipona bicolor]|uniref:Uncharacterized protein n=1 Tax=Melipona bicolor TaxID=60889 RepID=A0AA40FM85_9HYME|nr:hypothetical protein K0M31_010549 [Melipona bicolor]